MDAALVERFAAIGLSEKKAQETASNKKLSVALAQILDAAGVNGCDWSIGTLYYELAPLLSRTESLGVHLAYLCKRIKDQSLRNKDQVAAAVAFLKDKTTVVTDDKAFDEACGVGVDLSRSDIVKLLNQVMDGVKDRLAEERYRMMAPVLKLTKEHALLRWADGKLVKDVLDEALLARLGPKDDAPVAGKKKKEKKDEKAKPEQPQSLFAQMDPATDPFFTQGDLSRLHRPGGNPQIKPELMAQHLKETGGKVMSRFPPEPNGYLHIGHAKAINVNFGYAQAHDGNCYLRYDDTNPEAEEEQFFTSIKDSVEWLGFKPWKITYSSDHFQRLYDLAVELIRRDKAYVCHMTGEEIHASRGGEQKGPRHDSPWRNRPIEESLREFQRMKEGYYAEGKAILRMKMDMQHTSPQFWDLVAYRVMFTPHFRTGKDWCIYPTYDYTHCLCDSFENITHSMCTTEFRLSRESYYWLCDALEVYKPVQWEYGRLNLTNTVLSKRKLTKLVEGKVVDGWDDPRLYTMVGLKRRGVPPEAINRFVRECGVTTAETTIDSRRLDFFIRAYLDDHAPRLMAVLEPLPILLTNVPADFKVECEVPFYPKSKQPADKSLPMSHKLRLSSRLWIDRSDFRPEHDENFYRLTPNAVVGLLYAPYPVYCHGVVRNGKGEVEGLACTYLDPQHCKAEPYAKHLAAAATKPKAHIQWVPEHGAVDVEARLYEPLFLHENPMDKVKVPGGWLSDINPNSRASVRALVEPGILGTPHGGLDLKVEQSAQFVRMGYFCVDPDTKVHKTRVKRHVVVAAGPGNWKMDTVEVDGVAGLVVNRTVGLREDNKKD